ncbi:hypothetical protein ACAG24_021370 [Mycobacterium sp. pW049]|uniref:hypothetical protein n=1 Tax=[Mycobacterium] bulgaricum TaxID=3238985 RepID=UPI00351B9FD6
MAGAGTREFVSQVLELAVADSAGAWLRVAFDSDADVSAAAGPHAAIAVCRHGRGRLENGRLIGRWTTVVGALSADCVLLPAHEMNRGGEARRVLVSREDAGIEGTADGIAAGAVDVTISDLRVDTARIFQADDAPGIREAVGVSAVVVGSADGMLQQHIRQLRTQLAVSSGAAAVTEAVAAQIARAASDIDASKLQINQSLCEMPDLEIVIRSCRQAVARARAAADHLLEHSRHALDASDPATQRWRDVDAGSRVAVRVLDGLGAPLG